MKKHLQFGLLSSFLSCCLCSVSQGVVTSTNDVNASSSFFDSGITTSLITAGQPSLAGLTGTAPFGFALSGVNDGTASSSGAGDTWYYANQNNMPGTVTFTLTTGYDITSIQSLSGWGNTNTDGAYFGSQEFELLLKIGDSTTYTSYGTFGKSSFTGVDPVNGNTFSTLTTITDSTSGPIATNVTGIELIFSDPYPTTPIPDHGTVIREISAFGTPSVPEPASCGVAALAALGLLIRRRRI